MPPKAEQTDTPAQEPEAPETAPETPQEAPQPSEAPAPAETPQEAPQPEGEPTGELVAYGRRMDHVLGMEVTALDARRINLADVKTLDDAIALWQGQLVDAGALGDGFQLLRGRDGKMPLVGQTMLLADWRFIQDEQSGRVFVTVAAVLSDGRRFRFNDGGTGVCQQLLDFTQRTGQRGGLFVPHGLHRSEYDTEDANGNPISGITYYLDTSS